LNLLVLRLQPKRVYDSSSAPEPQSVLGGDVDADFDEAGGRNSDDWPGGHRDGDGSERQSGAKEMAVHREEIYARVQKEKTQQAE
jgi:hypothetical protein